MADQSVGPRCCLEGNGHIIWRDKSFEYAKGWYLCGTILILLCPWCGGKLPETQYGES